MPRLFYLSLIALLLLGLCAYYLFAPTQAPVLPPPAPKLSSDWQQQLAAAESEFTDIRPGLHKSVVWNDPERQQRTPLALVYVHGFFASKGELSPVTERLAAELGANIFFTRLQGHGRSDAALADATLTGWWRDVQEAWEVGTRLGERVVIVAASTGGTLATLLAHDLRDDPRLAALVLSSPNFHPKPVWGTRLALLPGGLQLLRLLLGANPELPRDNDLQRLYWNTSYPVESLLPMMQAVSAVAQLDLSVIETPVLMFYSDADQVVDSDLAQRRWQSFGSDYKRKRQLRTNYPGNHILAGDAYSPENNDRVVAEAIDFLAGLTVDASR